MTSMQYNIIGALAIAAAASILLFDTVGRTRKPAASLVAWLVFCQMGCLAVAAFIRADAAVQWLLIGGLAVHAINIVLAKGNINRVRPHLKLFSRRAAAKGCPKKKRHQQQTSPPLPLSRKPSCLNLAQKAPK